MAVNLKDIKSHMKGYRLMDLAARDVQASLQHYKDLKIGSDNYIHNDGRKEMLFRLKGTIPVSFRGNNYNIPIIIWVQRTHPQINPIVFVTPTPEMSINPSRFVDHSGRVYLPYISEWKQGKSDLATLIQILCATFADNIPVYSRQQAATGYNQPGSYRPPSAGGGAYRPPHAHPPPQPQPGYNPYPQAQHPPYPQPGGQPGYPGPTPYPVQASMPTPGGYQPQPAPYPTGGYNQPPYPSPQGHPGGGYPPGPSGYIPPYPQPGGVVNAQPQMSAEEERRKKEEEERERAKENRISLESAVEDKIKRQLQNIMERAEDEMKALNDTQKKLKDNNEKLTKMLREMETKQNEVNSSIDTLRQKTAEVDSIIEYLESQPDEFNIDEAIVATNPVHNQILRLYAEENAIDDTIYYLGEALRRGVITSEAFLKHVRDLSRRQFMARATIIKAREASKLPPHGIPG
uniref:UEV domain-containing protein n=2 Tax=Amphimedon queenslandica TaxID=400682 RepID=A0A1X7UNL7_AMPQE